MRILIAVDGSTPSELARDLAAGIPWPPASTLRVVAALEIGGALFGAPWYAVAPANADELEERYLHELDEYVAKTATRLQERERSVQWAVIRGRAATAIVEEARRFGADLVIVGSRGHGALEEMLLGSVSAEVVDHAPCPVLVARRRQFGSALLADDGSAGARAAAEKLLRWPIFAGLPLRVLSVAAQPVPWEPAFPTKYAPSDGDAIREGREAAVEAHRRIAADTADRLRRAGLSAEADVRAGDAAHEIVAAARETGADVVVMGTRGHTGLARLVLGSVARNVLHHAPCSVLVVRERIAGGSRDRAEKDETREMASA
jgi:nucleotide-binding universal stress UspA family protein